MEHQGSLLVVVGVVFQVAGVLPIVRAARDRLGSSVGLWVYVGFFVYHGLTAVMTRISDAPKPGYQGLQPSASEFAHIIAALAMIAMALGYAAASFRHREVTPPGAPALSSVSRVGALFTTAAAAAVFAVSLLSSVFFSTRFDLAAARERDYVADASLYVLPPLTMLSAAYISTRLFRFGHRRLALLPPLACFGLAALSGRRSWMILLVGSLLMALSSIGVRLMRRRHIVALASVFLFVSAAYVSFRAEFAGKTETVDEAVAAAATFAATPQLWLKWSDIADDFSYRLDGHVFLSQVLQGQEFRDPLGIDSISGTFRFLVPGFLWPAKTAADLFYVEDMSIRAYGMPPIDYTPTLLDESVALVGPWFGLAVLFAFGAALGILDIRLNRTPPTPRLILYATLVQGLISIEQGVLGLLLGARTMLVFLAFYWVAVHLAKSAGDSRNSVAFSSVHPSAPNAPRSRPG